MSNLARFTINGTPSTNAGYDGTISQPLVFGLEGGPANLVQRWSMQVYGPVEADAPLASKDAPLLSLIGATTGEKVDAVTPATTILSSLPASVGHAWIARSLVNGGLNAKGKVDPDYVFERMIVIRTGAGLRKIVATEATQYGPGGWADAINETLAAGVAGAAGVTPVAGSDLIDANQSVQPSSVGCYFAMRAGVQTANRTVTLGVAGAGLTAGMLAYILRQDLGPYTLGVINGGTNGTTIFTFPASSATPRLGVYEYNGVDWVPVFWLPVVAS